MTKYVIFHVFSKAFPRVDFGRQKPPSYPQKWDFGAKFGTQWGPTCDPWGAIFGQQAPKGEVHRTTFCVLGPIWARPATQNHPRTHLHRFEVDLGLILDRNLSDFERMLMIRACFFMFFLQMFEALPEYTYPRVLNSFTSV